VYLPAAQDWRLSLSYNQNNNIYYWRGAAAVKNTFGKGFFSINDNFDISRITTGFSGDKWKDINQFIAQVSYPLAENVTAIMRSESNYLTDRQSGFLNNISEHAVISELPVFFANRIAVTPLLGFTWDKRVETPDKGLQKGLDIALYETHFGEYYGRAEGSLKSERLDNRHNSSRNIHISVRRSFYGEASDTLSFSSNRLSRDYYVSATGDLESRMEKVQKFSNVLDYNLSRWSVLFVQTDFSRTNVDITSLNESENAQRRTRKDDSRYVNLVLQMRKGTHRSRLHFSYDMARQRYKSISGAQQVFGALPFDIPDNDGVTIELGGLFSGKITRRQEYNLETFIEKYRFDTPSASNYDDHDEFRFGFKSRYSYAMTPRLSVTFNALASLNHLVYVFRQRSADNNWNRIFQTGSLVEFKSRSGIRLTGKYGVLANYIVYDFDDSFSQIRSFVFRKFSADHTFIFPLTPKGTLDAKFQINLEENGLLRWDQFIQNILIDRKIVVASIAYDYQWSPRIHILPEYSTFRRTERRGTAAGLNAPNPRLSSFTDNSVMLGFTYQVKPSARLNFKASKRFIKRGSVRDEFQYVDLSINWLF